MKDHPILKRRGGVLVPLTSILTRSTFECGDIASLLPFAGWAKDAGFSIIQILPLNDTGTDTSPYSSISAFAIDPIYISLKALGSQLTSRKTVILSNKINHLRIRGLKLAEIRRMFLEDLKKNTQTALDFLATQSWAYGYVTFRVLYDEYNGADWTTWKKEHQDANVAKQYVFEVKREDALFYAFVQSIAFTQLKQAKEALETLGVYLKGDMPILTSRNSADVWEHPELFELELQAGAPPDVFSDDGQNWGFPVLNWPNLRKSNFRWWQDRLTYLENFFHLYRIDHVIGMYRIWAIPVTESSARKGWFYPQIGTSRKQFVDEGLNPDDFVEKGLIHEFKKDFFIFYWDFWKEKAYHVLSEDTKRKFYPLSEAHLKLDEAEWAKAGEEILDALDRFSSMMPCAEDLGAVPRFVANSLKDRETLGIDVIRWTRSLENGEYIQPEGYRKLAVSVLSTHDTSLALEWWQGLSGQELLYAENVFFTDRDKLLSKDKEEVLLGLLDFAFSANSIFSIQMLQDLIYKKSYGVIDNPSTHRINVPGTKDDKNWTYRFSFFLEDLIDDKDLSLTLRKKLLESDRLG